MNSESFVYLFTFFVIGICLYFYIYDSETLQLKCIVSTVDGNKYCVRDRAKLQEAADLLAKITEKLKRLVKYMGGKSIPTKTTSNVWSRDSNHKRSWKHYPLVH